VEILARVKISNPTGHLALLVQLALTQGRGGGEILPVLWEDNYFSLMPGATREVTARLAAADAGSAQPYLEVGGWNTETDFTCDSVEVSPISPKAGEQVKVTAVIMDTFLDGSRVSVRWDGIAAASTFAWARNGKTAMVTLLIDAPPAGKHELAVGNKKLGIAVRPE